MTPYENYIIEEPILGKDGRLRINIHNEIENKWKSYPKYLMEIHLGRYLENDETVHHLDHNPLNNDISNLIVLSRREHVKLDIPIKWGSKDFCCLVCNNNFVLSGRKLRDCYHNRLRGKVGPFCSKKCAGIASHNIDRYSNETFEKVLIKNLLIVR